MSVDSARQLAARTLRYFPNAKIAARRLDRGLTGRVDRVRQEFQQQRAPLRRVTLAISGDAVADARFAAVLDGRTLNIDVPVPRLRHDEVLSAELRAVHGADRRAIPARVRPEPDGTVSIEATALLDDNPGGLALRPGRLWLLELAVRMRAGGEQILKVLGGRQQAGTRGLTVASPPHPDTGFRYRVRLRASGRLALGVTPPAAPAAEVSRVELDWLRAALEIRLVGRPLAGPATVEIVKRSGTARVTASVEQIGADRVRCDLPLTELAAFGGGSGPVYLHVFLRSGGQRLRVGRVLHDLTDAEQILKPTPAIVWAAPGRCVRVEVRFSTAGAMSLACRTL